MNNNQVASRLRARLGTIVYRSDGNYDRNCAFNSRQLERGLCPPRRRFHRLVRPPEETARSRPRPWAQTCRRASTSAIVGSSGQLDRAAPAPGGLRLHGSSSIDPYLGPCNSLMDTSLVAEPSGPTTTRRSTQSTTDCAPARLPGLPDGGDSRTRRPSFYLRRARLLRHVLPGPAQHPDGPDTASLVRPNGTVFSSWTTTPARPRTTRRRGGTGTGAASRPRARPAPGASR